MKKPGYLTLLLTVGVFFLMNACGGLETTEEPEPGLTSADISVLTLSPEVNDKEVILKAAIEVDVDKLDQELVWGFMWFVDNGTTERDIKKLTVGKGFFRGPYKIFKDDFPSEKEVAFCAFVDFKASPNAEVEQILGEEIWFDTK
ncbi:MAG: hypothetical protein HEP71_14235 [Roseivirga sp.]|nr:hypothetical protein [Roseivirga sp.]